MSFRPVVFFNRSCLTSERSAALGCVQRMVLCHARSPFRPAPGTPNVVELLREDRNR
jgi:hypothetical protein